MSLPILNPTGTPARGKAEKLPSGPQRLETHWGEVWYHAHPAPGVYHLAISADQRHRADNPTASPTKQVSIKLVLPSQGYEGGLDSFMLFVPEAAAVAFPALANLIQAFAQHRGIGAKVEEEITLAEVRDHLETIRSSIYEAHTDFDGCEIARVGIRNLIDMIEGAA